MSPPRVLFLEGYPGFRGAQRSLATLVRAIGNDVDARFLVTAEGRSAEGLAATGRPVEVEPLPPELDRFQGALAGMGPGGRWRAFQRGVLPAWRRFDERFRTDPPALLHCNQARGVLLAGRAARRRGIPTVWHLRGVSLESRWLQWWVARSTSRIVCVSGAVRDRLYPTARRRAVVVHNAFDADAPQVEDSAHARSAVDAFRRERGLAEGFTLVTASSFVPYKGLHHVVPALAEWFGRDPAARNDTLWVILGDDDGHAAKRRYREHLVNLIESSGLAGNVAFAGWQDEPRAWFAAADTVVLPTVERETLRYDDGTAVEAICSEGFPRTVLEAMATGTAVIATDVPGVREQMEHDLHGFLVPPSDAASLSTALERVARDVPHREAVTARARERVRTFSVGRLRDGILAVYRELGLEV